MCEHCHESPCIRGCPCRDDTNWGVCKICGRPVLDDDEYVELYLSDQVVHLECLVDKIDSDPRDAIEMLGGTCQVAKE